MKTIFNTEVTDVEITYMDEVYIIPAGEYIALDIDDFNQSAREFDFMISEMGTWKLKIHNCNTGYDAEIYVDEDYQEPTAEELEAYHNRAEEDDEEEPLDYLFFANHEHKSEPSSDSQITKDSQITDDDLPF
jgi:hypothetical protein